MAIPEVIIGFAALISGAVKYGIDEYRAKHDKPNINVSIGSETITVPSSYTPEQVAALVTSLKQRAAKESPNRVGRAGAGT